MEIQNAITKSLEEIIKQNQMPENQMPMKKFAKTFISFCKFIRLQPVDAISKIRFYTIKFIEKTVGGQQHNNHYSNP